MMRKYFSKLSAFVATALAFLTVCCGNVMADLVEVGDGGTIADVTFNPGEIVTPVIKLVAAIVISVSALWLVYVGVKWIQKFLHGGK